MSPESKAHVGAPAPMTAVTLRRLVVGRARLVEQDFSGVVVCEHERVPLAVVRKPQVIQRALQLRQYLSAAIARPRQAHAISEKVAACHDAWLSARRRVG